MKAVAIREHGDLSVVHVEELPKPAIQGDEVLVKVLYAGLNHLDIWVCKGRPGVSLNAPHILGSDAVGVVEAIGEHVRNVKVGETVVVYPGLGCGRCESCAVGERSLCESFGIVGLSRPGTFAEYVVLPAGNVYPKPSYLSEQEAGGFVLACLTAWRMLVTRACVRPGDCVLIHGIGGGVALYALQWTKIIGAQSIVTSSSDEKLSKAKELGADYAINYKSEDVVERVKAITGGLGADVAVDAVGAATWPLDFAAVHKGGRIVLCGVTTGPTAEANLQALYWNQLTVLGSTLGSIGDLQQMARAATTNRLRPIVDRIFPLDKAQEALKRMADGRQFGKIVLQVSR